MKGSKKVFGWSILFVVLVLIGGCFYFYANKKLVLVTLPTPSVSPTHTETSLGVGDDLLIIQQSGGFCQHDDCSSRITIKKDRTFIQGAGYGRTEKVGKLAFKTVKNLQTVIENTDYSALRSKPFTDMCPTEYDGTSVTYQFQTSHGEEVIDSCETQFDSSSPLFKEVQNAWQAIYVLVDRESPT